MQCSRGAGSVSCLRGTSATTPLSNRVVGMQAAAAPRCAKSTQLAACQAAASVNSVAHSAVRTILGRVVLGTAMLHACKVASSAAWVVKCVQRLQPAAAIQIRRLHTQYAATRGLDAVSVLALNRRVATKPRRAMMNKDVFPHKPMEHDLHWTLVSTILFRWLDEADERWVSSVLRQKKIKEFHPRRSIEICFNFSNFID